MFSCTTTSCCLKELTKGRVHASDSVAATFKISYIEFFDIELSAFSATKEQATKNTIFSSPRENTTKRGDNPLLRQMKPDNPFHFLHLPNCSRTQCMCKCYFTTNDYRSDREVSKHILIFLDFHFFEHLDFGFPNMDLTQQIRCQWQTRLTGNEQTATLTLTLNP